MTSGRAFDEMTLDGGACREAYAGLSQWLQWTPVDHLRLKRQEADVLFPPVGHYLRRLWRGRRPGTPDPVRSDPQGPVGPGMVDDGAWPASAGQGAEYVHQRRLSRSGNPARRRGSGTACAEQQFLHAGNAGRRRAAGHLQPYRRDRHGAGRRGRVLRPGGQLPNAVRRLLHAGKPGSDDAAVPVALLAEPGSHRSTVMRMRCWRP